MYDSAALMSAVHVAEDTEVETVLVVTCVVGAAEANEEEFVDDE